MLARDELAAWLRLLETQGIGLEAARRLLARAGSAQAVFDLPGDAWQTALNSAQREALSRPPEHLDALLELTWEWLNADSSHDIMLLGDADYPSALLQTADPPLLLYLHGRRELLGTPALAVVGSRSPTAQGSDNALQFAQALSMTGLTIVSGLALGIDGAAHQGALDGALEGGASTIAVLGTGLDQIYPKRHLKLGQEIIERGLLLSEYSLGTPVLPPNFPRRNRLIAGLSLGCLVVEAALKSGSLITARLASEAGREVFAIPGSIHSPLSQGCHALIRQGAKLVERLEDILEELPSRPDATNKPLSAPAHEADLSPQQGQILKLMGFDPISLDGLAQRGGWPVADLSGHLLELELTGEIARLAGQLFQRRKKA
ncbi:DNA-processing protein DprA [Roseateles oligotrophus]|uniref:DNA-processing protein DprA n=1 Tax=Roseateles oligotrophus TaxID=1769250 RepID=A0ABT2YHI9_9BURK|nr:DNA-processing protein DprA [Roseateles oligotrophus]MCV2369516.1 DNA-processing protein DprA [Roseateles oligotrophus]